MITQVGSRAIKNWFPDFREPTGDWDYFTDTESQASILEATFLYPQDKLEIFTDPRLSLYWKWGRIATPAESLTIKMSHMYWIISDEKTWDKHMGDIIFLQRKGIQYIPELYNILYGIWKEKHKKKEPNLTKNKEQFFNDAVVRKYDHDSLHRSVAYTPGSPLYEIILKPGSEVDCSWEAFQVLFEHEQKLQLMREEIYVTALERILIPTNYEYSPRAAYHWALRRCITSLFKGEWAKWMVLHLDELRKPDVKYMQHHLDNRHLLEENKA